MKKILVLLFSFLFSLINAYANIDDNISRSEIGIVKNIEYLDIDTDIGQTKQIVDIELRQGQNKGQLIQVENILTGNPYYDINLKNGMKVVLHLENENNNLIYSIENIKRSNILVGLSILFCVLLIYVGKKKGFYSFISIIITCIFIFYLLSPMILIGFSPIIATFLISLFSTAFTIYLVGGINKKSSSAILGCIFSLIFATIISFITAKLAFLNGFNSEYSIFLYAAHPELNFVSLTIATIILATLGAVMDVAMSIASTINEICVVDNSKTIKELFTCGMNVGKDIIGTMANTLILVYLGTSLPLLLLTTNVDLQKFFNLNQVVTEIASALIGSCAIVICVPITAFIASHLIKNDHNKIDFSSLKK